MNRFYLEMFWTPTETVTWIRKMASELELWTVLWRIGEDARMIDTQNLNSEMFTGKMGDEDSRQVFLGEKAAGEPVWCTVGSNNLLDFQKSYAVQLVPALMVPDEQTLLQGRLAILRRDQYGDRERCERLIRLFHRLQSSLAKESDRSRMVTQVLSNGDLKVWKDILVGKALPTTKSLKLKQFLKGEVVFRLTQA